jgi:hypothetical protein
MAAVQRKRCIAKVHVESADAVLSGASWQELRRRAANLRAESGAGGSKSLKLQDRTRTARDAIGAGKTGTGAHRGGAARSSAPLCADHDQLQCRAVERRGDSRPNDARGEPPGPATSPSAASAVATATALTAVAGSGAAVAVRLSNLAADSVPTSSSVRRGQPRFLEIDVGLEGEDSNARSASGSRSASRPATSPRSAASARARQALRSAAAAALTNPSVSTRLTGGRLPTIVIEACAGARALS